MYLFILRGLGKKKYHNSAMHNTMSEVECDFFINITDILYIHSFY